MVKRFFRAYMPYIGDCVNIVFLGCVSAADTPDNKVGLEIKFDYDKYICG